MQIKWWYFLSIGVLIVDLVSKALLDGKTIEVINGFFGFVSVHNTGASFGVFAGAQTFFIVISILFALGMLAFDIFYKKGFGANGWYRVGFTMILGGLLGNLIDRIAFGYVRDFVHLEFMDFPVFNVADIALTIGCICIIVFLIFFFKTDIDKKVVIKSSTATPEITNISQINGSTSSNSQNHEKDTSIKELKDVNSQDIKNTNSQNEKATDNINAENKTSIEKLNAGNKADTENDPNLPNSKKSKNKLNDQNQNSEQASVKNNSNIQNEIKTKNDENSQKNHKKS